MLSYARKATKLLGIDDASGSVNENDSGSIKETVIQRLQKGMP